MKNATLGTVLVLAALCVGGCSGGLGGATASKSAAAGDPDPYPATYRHQVVDLLTTRLTDRADFHGALIAPPALKPIPPTQKQHYVVCLRFNGRNVRSDKVVVYLEQTPTQYLDASPELCGGAVYQPFAELEGAVPDTSNSSSNPFDFSYKQ